MGSVCIKWPTIHTTIQVITENDITVKTSTTFQVSYKEKKDKTKCIRANLEYHLILVDAKI